MERVFVILACFSYWPVIHLALFTDYDSLICSPLRSSVADLRNAKWYPANCSTVQHPLRTRCYLICKEDYIFEANSLMFVDCVIQHGSGYWFPSAPDKCISKTRCPKLSGIQFDTRKGKSCNSNEVFVGERCTVVTNVCPSQLLVGPRQLNCLENGTWSGGGAYCKEKPLKSKITCPVNSIVLQTDNFKPYVDARRYIPKPLLANINPSQVNISINLEKLLTGHHIVKFTAFGVDGETHVCKVSVLVEDREQPQAVNCVEEKEYIVKQYGGSINIPPSNYTFIDNTGNIAAKFLSPYKNNNRFTPGVYRFLTYVAQDSYGNKKSCKTTYQVHGRRCKEKSPALNINITTSDSLYIASCRDNTYRSYIVTDAIHDYPFSKHFDPGLKLHFRTCKDGYYIDRPFIGCYKKQLKETNASCPNGTVVNNASTECVTCAIGFYFRIDDRLGSVCELCPVNTTTKHQGSSLCVPCPKNSWTVGDMAPRVCQSHCSPGFVYRQRKVSNCSGCDKESNPSCAPICKQTTQMTCEMCPLHFYSALGFDECISCPVGTVTLQAGSSSSDCVPGQVLTNFLNSSVTVTAKTAPLSVYFFFNISGIPANQLQQRLAVKIQSTHLLNQTSCTSSFAQIKGVFGGFITPLSGRICGHELNDTHVVEYRPWRDNYIQFVLNEPAHMDLRISFGLADCERGMFLDIASLKCEKCPIGTYQDKFGAVDCKSCGENATTYLPGQSFCIDVCPLGFTSDGMKCVPCQMNSYSKDGICAACSIGMATADAGAVDCSKACSKGEFLHGTSCTKCPIGFYQPLNRHSQKICWLCPAGTTTLSEGTRAQTDCISHCKFEGEYYNFTEHLCLPCPLGSYKVASEKTLSLCTKCPSNMITKHNGSIRRSDCIRKQPIKDHCLLNNSCVFPSQCVSSVEGVQCLCPKFMSGTFCEKISGPCSSTPCQNNGTCHAASDTLYNCVCELGFVGQNCEQAYHQCDDNPCWKGQCVRIESDFKCICPAYATGMTCKITLPRPCDNRSICLNGQCTDKPDSGVHNYTCKCNEGFEGNRCEKEIKYCSIKPCNITGSIMCVEGRLNRRCVCKPGFYGDTCDRFHYCPAGAFIFEQLCCSCWPGFYSTKPNVLTHCRKCPVGKTTLHRGAENEESCIDLISMDRYKVKVLYEGSSWQSNVDVNSCGRFEENIENQLMAAIGMNNVTSVLIVEKHKPPVGKIGMVIEFVIYDGNAHLLRDLERKVKTGHLGSLRVDGTFLMTEKISSNNNDKETKKKGKNHIVVYVVVVVVILLIIAGLGGFLIHKQKRRTSSNIVFKSNSDKVDIRMPMMQDS